MPVPDAEEEVDFGIIARFMRNADDLRLVAFFQSLRQIWLEIIEKDLSFKYLSTHGLGVYWLHARFDVRPKYYHTLAYK